MKSLPQKVRAVNSLFSELDKRISLLQKHSSLGCPSGCGKCCEKPAIEVTALEFLPFALAVYDEGKHEVVLELCVNNAEKVCVIFRQHMTRFGGLCSAYPHRGLMCRLFGFAARINREDQAELVTCKIIKEEQSKLYNQFQRELSEKSFKPPLFPDYYMRLRNIDYELCEMMPINQAIALAIRTTMHYYSYRRRRKSGPISDTQFES